MSCDQIYLTGSRDTDILVTQKITDTDLTNLCIAEPRWKLSKDDVFWKTRLFQKYGEAVKRPGETWKHFYLKLLLLNLVIFKLNHIDFP